jgi:hypothetical protein
MGLFAAYAFFSLVLLASGIPLALRKVPPNPLFGFRVRGTLRDEKAWYATNAALGRGLIAVALVCAVLVVVLHGADIGGRLILILWTITGVVGLLAAILHSTLILRKSMTRETPQPEKPAATALSAVRSSPSTTPRNVLDALSVLTWCAAAVYLWTQWSSLPTEIAIHFDALGRPDRWGSKNAIIALLLVPLGLTLLLAAVRRFAYRGSYPDDLVPALAPAAQSTMRGTLAGCITLLNLLFAGLLISATQVAQKKSTGLWWWLVPVFLVLLTMLMVWSHHQMQRLRNQGRKRG